MQNDTPHRFLSLSEEELETLWAERNANGLSDTDQRFLRTLLRDRKGFKPVEVHVSICQRCNLPADVCACVNR